MRTVGPVAVLLAGVLASALEAQTPNAAVPTGDPSRGKTLFEKTYRCYACHGFDAQSGSPRLVPMTRTQAAFITYLRKPSSPAMPAFADVPMQDLAEVYAYLRSLPTTSPSVDSLPLLRDILQRRAKQP